MNCDEPIAVSQDEWDEIHDCIVCSECELRDGCQTKPNFGCEGEEKKRRAATRRPTMPQDVTGDRVPRRLTPLEIAVRWYRPEEVHRCICQTGMPLANDRLRAIPRDVFSLEFAEWLCDQYRLAMAKGIQLGRNGDEDFPR